MAAAAANAVRSAMARSSNGSTSVRHTDRTPTTSSSSSIGAPMMRAIARNPLGVLATVAGVGEHVGDLRSAPVEADPTGEGVVVAEEGVIRHVLDEVGGQPRRTSEAVDRSVDEMELHAIGAAQPAGAVDDGPENEVEVGSRPAHRGEHLIGGHDLLAGIDEIPSQPFDLRRVDQAAAETLRHHGPPITSPQPDNSPASAIIILPRLTRLVVGPYASAYRTSTDRVGLTLGRWLRGRLAEPRQSP